MTIEYKLEKIARAAADNIDEIVNELWDEQGPGITTAVQKDIRSKDDDIEEIMWGEF